MKTAARATAVAALTVGLVAQASALAEAAVVDTLPPSVTVSVPSPVGLNGWHVGPVSVGLNLSDRSGIDSTDSWLDVTGASSTRVTLDAGPNEHTFTRDGRHEASWRATDNEGNRGSGTFAVSIDSTPPVAAVKADREVVKQHQDLTVTAECGDATSGLASCRLSGGIVGTNKLDTSTPGNVVVTATAFDNAGLPKSVTRNFVVVPVDTSPGVSLTVSGSPNESGWYTTRPTVTVKTFTGHPRVPVTKIEHRYDAGADTYGWTTVAGDTATIQTTRDGHLTYHARATDALDGTGGSRWTQLNVDTVPPRANLEAIGDVRQNEVRRVWSGCSDLTSGVKSCVLSGDLDPSTGRLHTERQGTFSVTQTATDVAGNVHRVTHPFTVGEPAPTPESEITVTKATTLVSPTVAPTVDVSIRHDGVAQRGMIEVLRGSTVLMRREPQGPMKNIVAGNVEVSDRFALPRLAPGRHDLTLRYTANGVVSSTARVVIVSKAATATYASWKVSRKKKGWVTVTVRPVGASAAHVRNRVVTIHDGSKRIGSGRLAANGTVKIRVPKLKKGTHRLTATYVGDAYTSAKRSAVKTIRLR